MYKECFWVLFFLLEFTLISIRRLIIFFPPPSTSSSLSLPLHHSPCSWVISCTSKYLIVSLAFSLDMRQLWTGRAPSFYTWWAMLNWNQLVRCSLLYFGSPVFHKETRFGSLPIFRSLFLWADRLLWLSVIFKHKGSFEKAQCKSHILHETVLIYFPWAFLPESSNNHPNALPAPPHDNLNHAFQHPVKGMGKCSVDGCHDLPAPSTPHPNTHKHTLPLFLQSLSAHCRCCGEPKDNSDIEGKYIGNFIYTVLTQLSFILLCVYCMTHFIISRCCVSVCLFLFLLDAQRKIKRYLSPNLLLHKLSKRTDPDVECVRLPDM